MTRHASLREPELSPMARRIVGAVLLSIGLHAAILGLLGVSAFRARLVAPPQFFQVSIQSAQTYPHQSTPAALDSGRALPSPVIDRQPRSPVLPKPDDSLPVSTAHVPDKHEALPVMDVHPLVDMTYYTARELDVLPQPVHPVLPNFPEQAKLAGLTGWVVLTLKLDDTGAVQSVVIKEANPPDVFNQSALIAFQHAHFSPGIKAGRAVYSRLEIKVHYGD